VPGSFLSQYQAELGMMGINTPAEEGGSELDALSYTIAMVRQHTY
jgi:alkylation response protein AidB-like acyl-CoA dehydrogenase